MIASLVICTVLYIGVTVVLTGMVPSSELGVADPLALALQKAGPEKLAGVFSFGAVIAMTAVLLVFQLGPAAHLHVDGARRPAAKAFAAKVHPRYRTPHVTTIITGVRSALPAMFVDINDAIDFTNIGTLFAFILVSVGVIALRYIDPDRPRPFRCPGVPSCPIAVDRAAAWR